MRRRRNAVKLICIASFLLVGITTAGCGNARPVVAKNVILMITDGCGFNAFNAASYYQHGQLGKQPYDSFPVKYACTTYAFGQDYQPERMWASAVYNGGIRCTDSAAAATALYTGVKTKTGRVGLSPRGDHLLTIAQLADARGKSTGTLSSVMFSHATPCCVWAHNTSRNHYAEIAREMIYDSGLEVMMGPGHPDFDNNGKPTEDKDYQYVGGAETWQDLTDEDGANGYQLAQTYNEFKKLAAGKDLPKKLVAIPQIRRTLQYGRSGKASGKLIEDMPDLKTMSLAAINVLAQNPRGFFLMVEGGAVDWANHANNLPRMIEEQVDFNNAVQAVVDWVAKESSWDETLVIVTSDHECGMLWGAGTFEDKDGNGKFHFRRDTFKAWKAIGNAGVGVVPDHQYASGSHTNTPVPLYAKGPGSEMFASLVDGTDKMYGQYVDNTDIFTVMRSALLAPVTVPSN